MRILISLLLVLSLPGWASDTLQFAMHNADGKAVTQDNYRGQYLLMAVGYTTCPDVCPTTLMVMTGVMHKLGADADKLTPVFVSIDPNRDTPEKLKKYVGYFHPDIEALIGTADQTQAIADNLGATYGYQLDGLPLSPPFPARYEVYHSAYFYLYDGNGALLDVFGYGSSASHMAASIAQYLNQEAL
ncbi:SCO family protein [Ferrimonas sp. SCSIO 43195]|uniref:SCO family protein n=1 Tax=Ferrimonas sp. SCSIO 43195 TaxID=2822844 RepID=UPI002075C5F4|nr:SCO family protein [Ferrimonas sp. SCSIO 43195]USD39363.1 SCO family protein [Ferrimonas sp. SCSIO 43195]